MSQEQRYGQDQYELCNKAVYHITRNGNASLVFTDLFFQIAKIAA